MFRLTTDQKFDRMRHDLKLMAMETEVFLANKESEALTQALFHLREAEKTLYTIQTQQEPHQCETSL